MDKTRRFQDKYCQCIEQLIKCWKNGADKSTTGRLACRAKFFHSALRIDEKIGRFRGELIHPTIHDMYYNLEDCKHDPGYTEKLIERMALREQHILECRALALQISSPIKEIESGPYNGPVTQEGLEELRDSLKHMKKAMSCKTLIDSIEGLNANRLALELGFISKWLETAKNCWLTKAKKWPYQPKEIFHGTLSLTGHCPIDYTDDEIAHVEKWLNKVEGKLEKNNIVPKNDESNHEDISFDELKSPILCITLAGIVRDTSSNVTAKMKRHKFQIVKRGGKNYCDLEHAKILWPQKAKTFNKKIKEMSESD